MQIDKLRKEYPDFKYNYYQIKETESNIVIKFGFEIVGLEKFEPQITIEKKEFNFKNLTSKKTQRLVFFL